VGLAERRLFAEGLTGDSAVMAQTARRWTRLELPPFRVGDEAGRRHWRSLLKATERQLVLAKAHPGMLTDLGGYLFARTTGHIGSFITLVTRGCYKAIRTGAEALTEQLLNSIRIDEASETACCPALKMPMRGALWMPMLAVVKGPAGLSRRGLSWAWCRGWSAWCWLVEYLGDGGSGGYLVDE
ncbi:MAG: hypothetical protein QOE23_3992, partial [Pseudonocardiales bacterium]|nr:hypothetical protein [Pseudonocardiales bacterium]